MFMALSNEPTFSYLVKALKEKEGSKGSKTGRGREADLAD